MQFALGGESGCHMQLVCERLRTTKEHYVHNTYMYVYHTYVPGQMRGGGGVVGR